jgi:helix-turn-helix, Psq domain
MSEETLVRDVRIDAAIDYYYANQANPDRISMRQIAIRFGVNVTTLSNRLRNRTGSRSLIGGQNRVFSKAQSDALLSYITDNAYIGSPCTYSMITEAIGIIKDASFEDRPSNSFIRKYIKSRSSIGEVFHISCQS